MARIAPLAAGTVAALLVAPLLGLPARAQSVTEFPIPTGNSMPTQITVGSDGALWFVESGSNKIGRITTAGTVTEFSLVGGSNPHGITTGPDGQLWFTENGSNKVGQITTSGNIREFSVPTANSAPFGITVGSDGQLWFTEVNGNKLTSLSRTSGTFNETSLSAFGSSPGEVATTADGTFWFPLTLNTPAQSSIFEDGPSAVGGHLLPDGNPTLAGVARGPDGLAWFADVTSDRIAQVSDANGVEEFLAQPKSSPQSVTTGPDGALWFTEPNAGQLGRFTTSFHLSEFPLPAGSSPRGITTGPDGALWFTDSGTNSIGRFSVPASTSLLFSATLPASRSIQVGHVATAFATIINTGASALNCGIVPVTPIPGGFEFQTTDPHTNALTGSLNTRVSIAGGASQTFVVAFGPAATADSAQVPINVVLGYDCDGDTNAHGTADAAGTIVGVNTLLLTFDQNPVPDVIAVGLTPSNDGFARTGGPNGVGLFAIATSNIGISATLTARVRLSNPSLPIMATVCQTNPNNGNCLAPPAATVSATIGQNQDQTWSVFLQANGMVAADPANSRAFLEFVDSNGVVRGSTSTAVTTQ